MAVSIDTVYQRVLALANKEQRGYITPQEFNLFANQAQLEIFDEYFQDVRLLGRIPGNNDEYSDTLNVLNEKIGMFEEEHDSVWMLANMPLSGSSNITIPDEIYKIGQVRVKSQPVELLNSKDYDASKLSALTAPTFNRPIGRITSRGLEVSVSATEEWTPVDGSMTISIIVRPTTVNWGYVIVNDKPLHNANTSVSFELHGSEETELVYKILKLAGINLKDNELAGNAQNLEVYNKQQEKK